MRGEFITEAELENFASKEWNISQS